MAGLNLRSTAVVPKTSEGLDLRKRMHAPVGSISNDPLKRGTAAVPKSAGDAGLNLRNLVTYRSGGNREQPFSRHSPAKAKMSAKSKKGKEIVGEMFHEVMHDEPSTVTRANVSGKRKEAMLAAIALSKARKAGVRIPKKKR